MTKWVSTRHPLRPAHRRWLQRETETRVQCLAWPLVGPMAGRVPRSPCDVAAQLLPVLAEGTVAEGQG